MKRLFIMALCSLMLPSFVVPAYGRRKAKQKKEAAAPQPKVTEGLFSVQKSGDDWFFIS